MNAAWQLQQGALQRASIMYAASLRNSFTHLTQGPLCCCHEIKLYVCIVSFLDPLHTARFTAPLCTCMHTRSHKPLYYCSASIFQVKWMYQYNCHIHNGPWLLLFAIKKFLFLTARLFWSKSGKLKEKERVNQPTLFQFFSKWLLCLLHTPIANALLLLYSQFDVSSIHMLIMVQFLTFSQINGKDCYRQWNTRINSFYFRHDKLLSIQVTSNACCWPFCFHSLLVCLLGVFL